MDENPAIKLIGGVTAPVERITLLISKSRARRPRNSCQARRSLLLWCGGPGNSLEFRLVNKLLALLGGSVQNHPALKVEAFPIEKDPAAPGLVPAK